MAVNVWFPIIKDIDNLADRFFLALKAHPDQQHPELHWNFCLAEAAMLRAYQVSHDFAHCYKGNCTNRIVRASCPLPRGYPENGNSIESLVGGEQDPVKALGFLLNSPKHADHLLGRTPFFKRQSRVGIAYVQSVSAKYQFYYVILISE